MAAPWAVELQGTLTLSKGGDDPDSTGGWVSESQQLLPLQAPALHGMKTAWEAAHTGIFSFFREGRARLQSRLPLCQRWAVSSLAVAEPGAGFLARPAQNVPETPLLGPREVQV